MPNRSIVAASGAEARLAAARRWLLETLAGAGEALVLAPSRGAADDLLRGACPAGGGLFGIHRATPLQLATELATRPLAADGLAPVTGLGVEALAARSISIAAEAGELEYFEPVAEAPGLARALAATLREIRGHSVSAEKLAGAGAPGRDLARLLGRYEHELDRWSLVDDAALLRLGGHEIERGDHAAVGLPVLLVDVAAVTLAERHFLAKLVGRAADAFATLVWGDDDGRAALEGIFGTAARDLEETDGAGEATKLDRLRRRVFAAADPSGEEVGHDDQSFSFLAAAGEGRECVEIARRIHALARDGVGFDEVAILLRDADAYLPLVEEALRRADVPAYFTRGTVRPHPAGRAFLALLDCATEGLSASRFAEYLSLGQVPDLDEAGAPPEVEVPWVAPDGDQLVFKTLLPPEAAEELEETTGEQQDVPKGAPVIAGSLRTPRGWERLLVDARVYGGLERWRERLAGLKKEIELQLRDLAGEEPLRVSHRQRRLDHLGHLERFALPVIEALAELPESAPWGEWLAALEKLAGLVLKRPEKVLTMLAELRPMDRVGPVGLDEVRRVLGERLSFLRLEPPARRYGRVLVATVAEIRGRSFEAVFLPGLAEGIFPRRAFEDPLLLDTYRRQLEAALPTQTERVATERLLLRIAAGAARSRLVVSYPKLDVLQGRPRVPSFYALDLLRAAEGHLPDLRQLETRAAAGSESLLGWPAPRRREAAIDDAEYDLAVLEPLLRHGAPQRRGRGHFLLAANERLTRSLRRRWRRWRPGFSPADGVVEPDEPTLEGLARHRLDGRSYSPTSLQRYAGCPYRFLLYAVLRLKPREEAVRLEQLDPLTRGSLFHEIQFELFGALERSDLLSFDESDENAVTRLLEETLERVTGRYHEKLAPAIERVWRSEIEGLHTDLRGWIRSLIAAGEPWRPARFELAFGLRRGSVPLDMRGAAEPLEEAEVLGGKLLRGAIDLVEDDPDRPVLRVTDHKTGKSLELPRLVVGGGKTLQPVLYALAAEKLLGRPVESGRLFFCTRRGRYQSLEVALDDDSRQAATEVLDAIDRAVGKGFLPAAPDKGECRWCDYRLVCGPNEETRIGRKHPQRLVPLNRLRKMP